MRVSTIDGTHPAPKLGRVLAILVVASAISAVALRPALAEGNDRRDEQRDEHHDNDRQKERPHGDRDRHEYRQPGYYPQPVYVAPPVYYPPQQSPGISLFLPLDIHVR